MRAKVTQKGADRSDSTDMQIVAEVIADEI
jgi:hypothetical protein